jgi:hypothetical protein
LYEQELNKRRHDKKASFKKRKTMRKQSILALGSSTALQNSGEKVDQSKIITPGNDEEK